MSVKKKFTVKDDYAEDINVEEAKSIAASMCFRR